MCGIVGAVAHRNVVPILIEGLRKLEYRGYDSAGLALIDPHDVSNLRRVRSVGRVAELDARAALEAGEGAQTGIAHTPLGNPWRGDRSQRPPACFGRCGS